MTNITSVYDSRRFFESFQIGKRCSTFYHSWVLSSKMFLLSLLLLGSTYKAQAQTCNLAISMTTTAVSCSSNNDGTASVTVSGGTAPYTYLWSTGATTPSITGLGPFNYSVTVTDKNGCTRSTSNFVPLPSPLSYSTATIPVKCPGGSDGSVTISASGGTPPYNFRLGAIQNPTGVFTGLSKGFYSFSLRDSRGCLLNGGGNFTITEAISFSTPSVTNASCNRNDGQISLTFIGATGTVNYSINTTPTVSNTTGTFTGLAVGTYSITATANGCTATTSVTVTGPPSPTRLYVKATTTGANTGLTWTDAFTDLQSALKYSCKTNLTEIWVAKGTYKPTTGTDRTIAFMMLPNVKIYGGFAGTETALSQRTPSVMAANTSILSGDLSGNDVITGAGSTLSIANNAENSYHVILNNTNGLTAAAVLDGFTITGGNANGGFPNDGGGGMRNESSSPMLNNVTFSGNNAGGGGGMYNGNSSPILSNMTFSGNNAIFSGGGMLNENSSPSLSNVSFSGNNGDSGGGMRNDHSSPSLSNVSFSGNNATFNGGGMRNDVSSSSLNNVTFSGNNATNNGGGMLNSFSNLSIKNSIFWGNRKGGTTVSSIEGDAATVSYSDIQGGYTGTGNINQDPFFVNAANPAGADVVFGTADDGLALTACSPALNVGNNAGVASTDIAGNPRIFNTTVDMGAYELQSAPIPSPTRLYVNASAAGANSGLSWADAFTDLQAALNYSCKANLTEIWVAKGTYKPTAGADRTISFIMQPNVAIYGGFPNDGSGTMANRNWKTNPTILSGDLNGDDIITGSGSTLSITNNAENSYHVIFNNGNGLTAAAVLDGFTITGGSANGGGMSLSNSSPTIANCRFTGNSGVIGGGIYGNFSSPNFSNIIVSLNLSSSAGGGMYLENSSSPSFINVIFSGNNAGANGGGMYFGGSSTPTSLVNVTFSGNNTFNGGGGIATSQSLNIQNSIFWGNTSRGTTVNNFIGNTPIISYSNIQGGFTGTANINVDPQFVNAVTGDLRLLATSCAINTGNNAAVAGISTDIAGNPRIYNNGTVDMGAYEYQGDKQAYTSPAIITTNNALNFDGTNDYVSLSTSDYSACTSSAPALTNALTIEYWFKGSNIQSAVRFQDGNRFIVAGWNSNSSNPYLHILSNDGGTTGIAVGAAATDGNWHHIAMTWQQGTANGFKSYLDGALVQQRDALNTPLPSISGLYLGANAGTGEFTNGSLDEVRVWNIARSQADIQAGMCGGVATEQTGLLMYYKFDHGAANGSNAGINLLLNSANPNQYIGTLQNFALTGTVSNWVSTKPLPAAPTSGGNQVQCQQSPIQTLTATATGGTITWYDAATGGNLVASPTLSTTGTVTYYAQASDGTCSSLTRTAVTLTINPSPAAPASGGNQVQCQLSPIQTLTATATGSAITWYDAATVGNLVASPTLSAAGTITYYAQASDGTCNSLTRTAVTLTINPAPAAPASGGNQVQCQLSPIQTLTATATGGTITWYDAATGGNVAASPTLSSTGSVTYYAQASNGTCNSLTRTAVTLTINPSPAAPASGGNQVQCQLSPIQTLTATATGSAITWYDAATVGNLVASPTLSAAGTITYYAQASDGTCNSLTRTAVTLTINPAPAAPTSGGNQVQCQQSPIQTLTATATGGTITWYDAATNGNVVASPTVSSTGSVTYYAQSSNGTCNSLTRTAVTLTINPAPAAPGVSVIQPTCATPSGTITVTSPTGAGFSYSINGTNYTNTSGVFSGLPSGGYSVTCKNSNGCISAATPVTLTLAGGSVAPAASVILQPSCILPWGTILVTAPIGAGIKYSKDGINYQTIPIFSGLAPATYYITAKNNDGCISLASAGLVVNPIPPTPPTPVVTVQNNCGSSTLTASGYTGLLIWSNGQLTPSITVTDNDTYNVVQVAGGCVSNFGSGVSAPKIIPSAPKVTVVNNCGSSTLTASNYTGSLLWSNGSTASSITVANTASYTVTQTVAGCNSLPGSGTTAIVKLPVVTCPSNITVNTDNGVCTAKANFSASATGSPAPTIIYKVGSTTITPGSYPFPGGTTTVNVSATNSCGTVTCSFTVTVKDVTAPQLNCPANQNLCKKTSGNYTIPPLTASDNCGIATVSYQISGVTTRGATGYNASGLFSVGISTITWTVKDINGNISTCTTKVTVSNTPCSADTREYVTGQNSETGQGQNTTTNAITNAKTILPGGDAFNVIVYPNPSTTDFKIKVESNSNELINIRVIDVLGRVTATITGVHKNSPVTIGQNYRGGSYFAEVVQGANYKTVKLIKIN